MEDRTLLSTFLVSNTDDGGPGSLRQAILDSDAAVGAANTIDFDISEGLRHLIVPASPLPAITNAVLIDGYSQPLYEGRPVIEISGSEPSGAQAAAPIAGRRPGDHRAGRHRPRPGHQQLRAGRRHRDRRRRRDRRLGLRLLHRHESPRDPGRTQRVWGRDRRRRLRQHRGQRRSGRRLSEQHHQRQRVRQRAPERRGDDRQPGGRQSHRGQHHRRLRARGSENHTLQWTVL